MSDFKVAIVLSDPAKRTETFVRRHVDHLFSGRTVVVATKSRALYPNRPTLLLAQKYRPRKWKRFVGKVLPNVVRERWAAAGLTLQPRCRLFS